MSASQSTFALFFGNRGFFPSALIADARRALAENLKAWGYPVLMMDEAATRYGAVETVQEGQKYANFLREHRGQYDGIILCLPNFGDENGAVTALKEAGVPILIQAYPDDLDKMAPELRRDAFCGKLSVTDVFRQVGIKFTALRPHTAAPAGKAFAAQVDRSRAGGIAKTGGARRLNKGAGLFCSACSGRAAAGRGKSTSANAPPPIRPPRCDATENSSGPRIRGTDEVSASRASSASRQQ